MTGPLQHSLVELYRCKAYTYLVECRCGWSQHTVSKQDAQEIYREHKKEAQSKLSTRHQK